MTKLLPLLLALADLLPVSAGDLERMPPPEVCSAAARMLHGRRDGLDEWCAGQGNQARREAAFEAAVPLRRWYTDAIDAYDYLATAWMYHDAGWGVWLPDDGGEGSGRYYEPDSPEAALYRHRETEYALRRVRALVGAAAYYRGVMPDPLPPYRDP